MNPAPVTSGSVPSGAPRDALARLTPLGWTGGLLCILTALAASFFLLGYFVVYWRSADMDLVIVYNALAMNDGKPQWYFDHPAYFTILSVKFWLGLLNGLGLIDAYSLSSIPPATDRAAFDAAMTQATRAARIVAWLTASGLVLIFAGLMRTIVRDWRVALLATFAFAFSGGVTLHLRMLRSELIASCLVVFAMMILIVAARRANFWRPVALAAVGLLCLLGLENKVQAFLLISALPVLALAFGTAESASVAFWRGRAAWFVVIVLGLVAGLLSFEAWPLIATGLDRTVAAQAGLRPLLAGRFGTYQIAAVLLTAGCMIAFAAIWRISLAETIASMLAVIAGGALGLLALNLAYDVNNVVAVINPVEKMLSFAGLPAGDVGGLGSALGALAANVAGILKRYSYVLRTSARPEVFLIWLIVPGIVYAWRKGERQTATQALLLLLTAFGIDVLGNQRGLGLQAPYVIFTDPLIIIAGALLLARLTALRFARWTYPIAVVLLMVHVVFSVVEPVKRLVSPLGPEGACEWRPLHMPLLPLPWCG